MWPGQGRVQARQLGRRRTGDGIAVVFSSDLARAAETVSPRRGADAVAGLPAARQFRAQARAVPHRAVQLQPAAERRDAIGEAA